ncbi:MAG: hypothetical protein ACE5JP_07320 [Candidatus Bipolaricaulia bacterium]
MGDRILFPTSVVGSLPRPRWLLDLLERHQRGELDEVELDRALDQAVSFAIALQEAAGVDILSDGEWRRLGYFEVFAQRVDGFTTGQFDTPAESSPTAQQRAPQRWTLKPFPQAVVTRKIRYRRPIVAEDARFLKHHAAHPIKVALPSPYLVANRLWHPNYSQDAYPTREAFIKAVIPIFQQELELAIDSLNQVVDGLDGIKTALHVCRGNRERVNFASGDYGPILPYLYCTQVDQLVMEFALPEAGGIDVFKKYPPEHEIGFAPTSTNPIPIDEAYLKLHAQSEATWILRKRYG